MRRSNSSPADEPARGNFTPPPRAAASPVDVPVEPPTGGGSTSKFSPRNWRVPTRLNAILLVPALVGLVMGGFQVKGSVDSWNEAKDAEQTARIVQAAAEYGQALLNERDLTAEPLLKGDRNNEAVTKAYAATDAAKAKFAQAAKNLPQKQGLERRLELFRQEEPKLEQVRKTAYAVPETAKKNLPAAAGPIPTEEGYVLVQHYLMQFSNELGLGTGNVTSYGRMVYAVELAKAANSLQRSVGTHLLVRPNEDENVRKAQLVAFSSYAYLEEIAIGEYVAAGTDEDTNRLKEVMGKKSQEGAAKLAQAKQAAEQSGSTTFKAPPVVNGSALTGMTEAIASGDKPAKLALNGTTAPAWQAAATAKFDAYAEIEKDLLDKAVKDAVAVSDKSQSDAILTGAIVVVAMLAAFILAGMMARQMSRAMLRLRSSAFDVAEQRLPMLVDQLSRTDPGKVDTRVQPIPINSQDEIGEVARAFDQVHREAVRLAAEQALLRGNVNAIFTNLSMRNQSLIEGQLTLITDLENNEADPDQLENLFRLDHLATRMRRNGENLLILAGENPGRRWDQPVPLVDVLRAASSEVEQYERIELSGVSEAEIHGQAVTDLVHLLAELLENATTFSSPQTKVRVNATRLPDGRVMVEIHDKGIGLTAEDFADINHKLANPPTVDAAISQRMGLFVVGRLADRHSIRVQLRPRARPRAPPRWSCSPTPSPTVAVARASRTTTSPSPRSFRSSRASRPHRCAPPPNSASTTRATTARADRAPTGLPSTRSCGRWAARSAGPSWRRRSASRRSSSRSSSSRKVPARSIRNPSRSTRTSRTRATSSRPRRPTRPRTRTRSSPSPTRRTPTRDMPIRKTATRSSSSPRRRTTAVTKSSHRRRRGPSRTPSRAPTSRTTGSNRNPRPLPNRPGNA